jgi:hypothetical protein
MRRRGVNLTILIAHRENTGDGVIRGSLVEDGCRSKGRFEELKGVLTLRRPDPRGVLARKPAQ